MSLTGLQPFRYIALFPHEDASLPANGIKSRLFSAGFSGAYSFPLCAPLFPVDEPLRRERLREIAKFMRMRKGTAAFELASPIVACSALSAFAQELRLSFLASPLDAGQTLCEGIPEAGHAFGVSSLVISTLEGYVESEAFPAIDFATADFPCSFKSAYIANLSIIASNNSDSCFSLQWERGERVWLPR